MGKVPGKDLGFSAAARVPRLLLPIQKVADLADVRCEAESGSRILLSVGDVSE